MDERTLNSAMNIIMYAGDARSSIITALKVAREGSKEKGLELLEEAKKNLLEAHKIQTELLQGEMQGNYARDFCQNHSVLKGQEDYVSGHISP